jgi:hypothetical protein
LFSKDNTYFCSKFGIYLSILINTTTCKNYFLHLPVYLEKTQFHAYRVTNDIIIMRQILAPNTPAGFEPTIF